MACGGRERSVHMCSNSPIFDTSSLFFSICLFYPYVLDKDVYINVCILNLLCRSTYPQSPWPHRISSLLSHLLVVGAYYYRRWSARLTLKVLIEAPLSVCLRTLYRVMALAWLTVSSWKSAVRLCAEEGSRESVSGFPSQFHETEPNFNNGALLSSTMSA